MGESARFRLSRIWESDVLGAFSTAFNFKITATGPFAESVPNGLRTFGAGESELIIEILTVDDGAPGVDGLVTFELVGGLSETQATNIGGHYEVYDQWPGITPRGKNSRIASVRILNNRSTDVGGPDSDDGRGHGVPGSGDFAFADTDAGDGLVSVKVVTLPTAGSLALGGVAVRAAQVIGAANLGGLPALSTFAYQWLRVNGGTEVDIPGAGSKAYQVVVADAGAKFKVRVSFTDGRARGVAERRTRDAATTVTVSVSVDSGTAIEGTDFEDVENFRDHDPREHAVADRNLQHESDTGRIERTGGECVDYGDDGGAGVTGGRHGDFGHGR